MLNKKQIQDRLLQTAVTIKTILEKNNIPYFIGFGTLLGSIRHNGFIPWDDDFDFMLFEDDYENAIVALENELPQNLIIHNEKNDTKYFKAWSSVKDIDTIIEFSDIVNPENLSLNFNSLAVDLFKLKSTTYSNVPYYLINEELEYHSKKFKANFYTADDFLNKISSMNYEKYKLMSVDFEKYSFDEIVFMLMIGFKEPLKKDWILPLKKNYIFEGIEFYGPNDSNSVLNSLYGDYMTIPTEDKRISHYKSVKIK